MEQILNPNVSIIIPTAWKLNRLSKEPYLFDCFESIIKQDYPIKCIEIVIVGDSGTYRQENLDWVNKQNSDLKLCYVDYEKPFNFSDKCNVGAAAANGEYLIFLNDDAKFRNRNCLKNLIAAVSKPQIGAVGAILTFPSGRIQHAGIALSKNRIYLPFQFKRFKRSKFLRDNKEIEVTAITGACLATPVDVWKVNKWNEEFPSSFNDIDFCLNLGGKGLKVILATQVHLEHAESATRTPNTSREDLTRLHNLHSDVDWSKDRFLEDFVDLNSPHLVYRLAQMIERRLKTIRREGFLHYLKN